MNRILGWFGWWWNCWCRHCGQTRYNHPNGRMCKRGNEQENDR